MSAAHWIAVDWAHQSAGLCDEYVMDARDVMDVTIGAMSLLN